MARSRTVTSSKSGRSKTRSSKKRTRKTTTEQTSSQAAQATASSRRWWALVDLCGLLLSTYVLVALASWSRLDPGFSRVGSDAVRNIAGPVGAWLADFLFQMVGHGAWLVGGLGAAFLLRLSGRRVGGFSSVFGATVLSWAVLCALSLVWPMGASDAFPAGGMVGLTSTEVLRGLFGEAGAWLGLVGAIAVSLTAGVGVDWGRTVESTAIGVGSGVPRVAGAGRSMGEAAVSSVVGLKDAVLDRLGGPADGTVYDDTGSWADDTGTLASVTEDTGWDDQTGVVHSAAPQSIAPPSAAPERVADPSAVREPRRSRRRGRSTAAREALPALPVEIQPEPAVGPLARPTMRPPEVGTRATGTRSDTQVADRALVEVEWEATAASIGGHPSQALDPASRVDPFQRRDAVPTPVRPSAESLEYDVPSLEANPTPHPRDSYPDAFHADEDRDAPTRPSLAPPPQVSATPARRHAAQLAVTPGALESGGDDHGGVLIDAVDDISFELPHLGLLDKHERHRARFDEIALRALADKLTQKLEDFGVKGEVTAIRPGPVITTYEYLPAAGIKLSKITRLEDDIAMALCALRVRIVAPIPGKGVVGFEVPNEKRLTVWIRDILASDTFRGKERALPMALGKDVEGKPLVGDLAKAPHLLVAGTTGSGKSVGVNAMLMSMLYTRSPEELRLILIDPKMLEFELYQDIPHLLHPVVTDPALASAALKWACDEMDRRYQLLARWKTRNISSYNQRVKAALADWSPRKARQYAPKGWPAHEPPPPPRPLPYIVVVIDELADLMMVAAKDVEVSIARLAQKARAAGIHLVVATQRPEKTVVTGIIKANLPSRIAFQVRSKLDGRIILDTSGAEALLGKGDMLYLPPGTSELVRCQSPFVDDDEVRRVTDHLRSQGAPVYEAEIKLDSDGDGSQEEIEYDELYDQAVAYVVEQGKASTSMVQRQFKIGYNRAARMIEVMEIEGVCGPADGARPRKILVPSHAM